MSTTDRLNIVIDIDRHADDEKKSDFTEQHAGHIEIIEDRVYITAKDICLGFDRYVLDELLKREGMLIK